MDAERQDRSRKKSVSGGASKRSDTFWGLIVPSERLERGKLDPNAGSHLAPSQSHHAEGLKETQNVVHAEKGTPHARTQAKATNLYPHVGVTHRDKKHVETSEKRRPGPTGRAQPENSHISVTKQIIRTHPVEIDKHADRRELSEDEVMVSTPTLHKGDKNEESSEGLEDTEGWDDEEAYVKDDDKDDSETASNTSISVTQRSQPSSGTPRTASSRVRGKPTKGLKKPSETITPNLKSAPSQPASAKGRRSGKRVKVVVEEEATNRSEPNDVNRPAKACAQAQNLSNLQALPPLSRLHQPWTKEEEESLFSLKSQGESWRYIGECVLGRTVSGVKGHWDLMRTESLQPGKTRAKGRRGRRWRMKTSVVSVMAKMPQKNKRWTKDEEAMLTRLRAQGKTLSYVSKRIRGKTYAATKAHWRKIKDRSSQAVKASKNLKADDKRDPSDRPDAQSSASQPRQWEEDAELNSRSSAITDAEERESSRIGDSPTDADVQTSSAKQRHQEPVLIHKSPVPAVATIDSQPANVRIHAEKKDEVISGRFISGLDTQMLGTHHRSS